MAIVFSKSLNSSDNYPVTEILPSTAGEAYLLGEALKIGSGALTKSGQTDVPTYVTLEAYIAPATENRFIKAHAILPEFVFEVDVIGDITDMPYFSKLILDVTGTNIMSQAGTPQKHTATAAGTVTEAGDAKITITSALFEDDIEVDVPVAESDNAEAIAGKIRAALAEDEVIADAFYVSGTGTSIVLTPIVYTADDDTLNIAIAAGTATGVTAAATSTNTAGTANGVATLVEKIGKDKAFVRFV